MIKGAIAGVALAVVAVITMAMIVVIVASDDQVDITELEVGQCFDVPDLDGSAGGDTIELVDPVDCGEPHTAEAVLTGDLNPDGGRSYPDNDELFSIVDARCAAVAADPRFGIVPVAPTEATWNGRNGRFLCVAVSFGLEPVVGNHAATAG